MSNKVIDTILDHATKTGHRFVIQSNGVAQCIICDLFIVPERLRHLYPEPEKTIYVEECK
jgi:hypothetical protein